MGLRLVLTVAAFAGMVALCIFAIPYGGLGGLIGGGLGIFLRIWGRGLDLGERLGNAYVGALMGMPVGLLIGGAYMVGLPALLHAMHTAS